jgi:hypothetical protein
MLFSLADVTQMQRNFNCSLLELERVKTCLLIVLTHFLLFPFECKLKIKFVYGKVTDQQVKIQERLKVSLHVSGICRRE